MTDYRQPGLFTCSFLLLHASLHIHKPLFRVGYLCGWFISFVTNLSTEVHSQRVMMLSSGDILSLSVYTEYRRYWKYILMFLFILVSFYFKRVGGASEFGKVDLSIRKLHIHIKIHQCCGRDLGLWEWFYSYVWVREANSCLRIWKDGYAWFQSGKSILVSKTLSEQYLFEKISPK